MPDELLAGQDAPGSTEATQAEAAQSNAATSNAQTDGAGDENDSPERTFTQKELDEILQKRIAKAERRAEQRVLKTLEKLQPQRQEHQTQADPGDGKPTRKEGEADDAYLDRLTDWKLEQREKAAAQERQREQAKSLVKKTDSLYAEAEKLQGFDRDAFDDLPMTKPIVEALIESDVGPQLMAYMASNPDEVERIAQLSPSRQAAELGKLEAKLASEPPPKKVSSAPAPLNPLRKPSGNARTFDTTDPRAAKELSTAEWIRAEEARMRKKYAGNA